ncbi:MAG: glycosyltransferase family 4 protein [Candidatus Fermentibacteraceae bacterium]|nr:glycosyltransferase family 4 protein [Candidatus Fermentibacteraceae bacterium]
MTQTTVLHIITKMAVGGAQMNTLISCREITRMGYPSAVLTGPEISPEGTFSDLSDKYGIPVFTAPHLVRKLSPYHDLRAFFEIRNIIDQNQYSIVHTHGSKAKFLGRLAAASAKTPVKIVQTVHGWSFFDTMPLFQKAFYSVLERFGYKLAHANIVVSPHDIKKGVNWGIGKPEDYQLIRSGVEFESFLAQRSNNQAAKQKLGIPQSCPVVGTVIRLASQKHPEAIVDVASKVRKLFPDVKFMIVGDGPLADYMKHYIAEMNLKENFMMLGSRKDVAEILPAFDVFLLTSRSEGLPRAMLEALAVKIPVVATDVGGIAELVNGLKNGFLCSHGDIDCLATGVIKLLESPELRSTLLSTVDQDLAPFSAKIMVEQLFQLYTFLVKNM